MKLIITILILSLVAIGQEAHESSTPQEDMRIQHILEETQILTAKIIIDDHYKLIAMQEALDRQNEMIFQLLHPPPPKHRKLIKVLYVIDRAASIAQLFSIFGIARVP